VSKHASPQAMVPTTHVGVTLVSPPPSRKSLASNVDTSGRRSLALQPPIPTVERSVTIATVTKLAASEKERIRALSHLATWGVK
jgi:hypothetical protein